MGKFRRIIVLVLFIFSIIQLRDYTPQLRQIISPETSPEESLEAKKEVEDNDALDQLRLKVRDTEYADKFREIEGELEPGQISKLVEIIDDMDSYPEDVVNLAFKNPETIEFVMGFPNKEEYLDMEIGRDESYALNREIPLFLQWDKRWGYKDYGSSIIAFSGCAPTSLSMVISGLNKEAQATPDVISQISKEKGWITGDNFSSWELMLQGGEEFGVSSREVPLDEAMIKKTLSEGKPVIMSMKPGLFTEVGHMIVLLEVDENGEFIINDANSIKRSNQSWKYSQLQDQVRNIWAYSLK